MKATRTASKPFGVLALMLASLTSWLPISGLNHATAAQFLDDAGSPSTSLAKPDQSTQAQVSDAYGRLPLSFEVNQGQLAPDVKFASHGRHQALYLTQTASLLEFRTPRRTGRDDASPALRIESDEKQIGTLESTSTILSMKLIGAKSAPNVEGFGELPGKSNYFIGNDPKKWRTGVRSYSSVRYRSVYRGIDLVYHGDQGKLEYDFKLAPGADFRAIRLAFQGAVRMNIDKNGELVLSTSSGEVRHRKPIAYQEVNGIRRKIAGRFVRRGRSQFGFAIARYDAWQPLVIDPVLDYSTYLGGSDDDAGNAVAVDGDGNAYVSGYTYSMDFPTANAFQPFSTGTGDAFVTKLNAAGTALIYSTYLGGSTDDLGYGIAIDASGNAYVTGTTFSNNFPTVNPVQPNRNGSLNDVFITKLNAAGAALIYSTYLGGTKSDDGHGIAVDASGYAYVAGHTQSSDFPIANALQPAYGGFNSDAFVAKLSPAGGTLAYATYLGGSGAETANAIAVDPSGNAYVTGSTSSANFPTANPLQAAFLGKTAFKSINGGSSWSAINTGLPGHLDVKTIAIDPVSPATLYAGTQGGVYKSTNSGDSWSAVYSGGTNWLTIDPVHPMNVYAAGIGVSRSTDGGVTWTPPAIPNLTLVTNVVVVDPVTTSTLYAGVNSHGVFKSTDSGASWRGSPYPVNRDTVLALAIDPTTPSTIYAGAAGTSDYGVFKSTDGGGTWAGPLLFGYLSINALAVDPLNTDNVYAAHLGNGIFKSTNGGKTWAVINNGLANTAVYALAIDPMATGTIYAGTGFGLFKSTNGGQNWNAVNNGLTSSSILTLAVDGTLAPRLYAGTVHANDAFATKLNPSGSAFIYSTYLGGSNSDGGYGIAADASGNAYLTGYTLSADFPTANAMQSSLNGSFSDAYVAKLNPSGAFVYSTYFGGSGYDGAFAIALSASGEVFLTGYTFSTDFPSTDSKRVYSGGGDAFVAELNPAAGFVIYSTYLGGSISDAGGGLDQGNGIAIDSSGNAYVAGYTQSADFPTTPGAFQTMLRNYGDGFVTKIESACVYSLSAASAAFPLTGGSGSVTINAPAGCSWTAMSNDNWVFITSANSGNGTASITFELRENFDERFRIGTLSIGGQTFTVLQEGLGSGACSNAISPTFASFPSIGGSGSVNVIANEECIWRAVSNTSWVTLTSNDNGIGVGVVTYSVGANAGTASRNGTITIAGQTFAIKQKGNVAPSHGSGGGKP
jgi:photosystem II stability/assembly factor-like uncharacterized protein